VGGARVRQIENFYNGPLARAGAGAGEPGETGADGGFELCAGAGPLKLRVEADGYGGRIVPVRAVAPRTRADVRLVPEAVIEGVVVRAETGAPIPDVQLALWPSEKAAPSPLDVVPATALGDGAGRFQVRGLAPGRYWLNAWAPDALARERGVVEVKPGEVKRGIVRRLHSTTTVEVRVVAAGASVAGAKLSLKLEGSEDDSSYGGYTQADGRATLHGVFRGTNVFVLPGFRVLAPVTLHVDGVPITGITVEVARAEAAPARR
jgi:hypothetical protein